MADDNDDIAVCLLFAEQRTSFFMSIKSMVYTIHNDVLLTQVCPRLAKVSALQYPQPLTTFRFTKLTNDVKCPGTAPEYPDKNFLISLYSYV
jgi:hypothetical protein